MSYEEYQMGKEIVMNYTSDDFYGVLQGLMRLADSDNLPKLTMAFPEVWEDLTKRYNLP